jgi:phosphate-selective porin OprO and OprP
MSRVCRASLPAILALAFAAPRVFAESDPAGAGFALELPPDLLSTVVQEPGGQAPAEEPSEEKIRVRYGGHGLEVTTADGHFRAWFTLRAQLRVTYPFGEDPRTPEDFTRTDETTFSVNRLRFKMGGHAYREWLDYYLEYEIKNARLLDLRFTIQRWQAIQFRLGQWKPEYNRERRDSSGEQQFVDRSIVNRTFTIDRQPGLMLSGRLWPGSFADSRYFAGVFSGSGPGTFETEGQPMWLARWQWNFLGRDLAFSQSDVSNRAEPAGSLAVGGVWNRSRYTRFSQEGGGSLDGFPGDVAERYDVEQAVAEAAYQHRGFSFQSEYHWKEIDDRVTRQTTRLEGSYAQFGYFFHSLWAAFPRPLELAARVAFVDPNTDGEDDRQTELTLGANWFFSGHRNKISADVSRLELEAPGDDHSDWRFRLQWDVSF